MEEFLQALKRNPIIASARDIGDVREAARTNVAAIFLLGGTILDLPDMVQAARRDGKRVFLHMDLLGGLGRDQAAVEWCAKTLKPDGIISTRTPLLRAASELGLITIQRLFVMDSSSVKHGVNLIKSASPDLLELLPGLLPKAIVQLRAQADCPIVAGGMITKLHEVREALDAGAVAVSTSCETLWRAMGNA